MLALLLLLVCAAATHRHGRRGGQGTVHRHRGHLQAAALGTDSREVGAIPWAGDVLSEACLLVVRCYTQIWLFLQVLCCSICHCQQLRSVNVQPTGCIGLSLLLFTVVIKCSTGTLKYIKLYLCCGVAALQVWSECKRRAGQRSVRTRTQHRAPVQPAAGKDGKPVSLYWQQQQAD
jgi:hypothetical protein